MRKKDAIGDGWGKETEVTDEEERYEEDKEDRDGNDEEQKYIEVSEEEN